MHSSTLSHQILAIVVQWGGLRADQIWSQLCQQGRFQKVRIDDFKTLLKHMGEHQFLTKLSSGGLVLGVEGKRQVNQYTFMLCSSRRKSFVLWQGTKHWAPFPLIHD